MTKRDFNIFIAEASVAAILDSGASANVAGEKWINSYLCGLPESKKMLCVYNTSHKSFKFGSDEKYQSMYRISLPAKTGSNHIMIETDVVKTDIPLLLSKDAMKMAETTIDFENDCVTMFGEKQKIKITKSGHYTVPISDSESILQEVTSEKPCKVLFTEAGDKNKIDMARKLHAQFGHPPEDRLLKFLERAGKSNDKELLESVKVISKSCKI